MTGQKDKQTDILICRDAPYYACKVGYGEFDMKSKKIVNGGWERNSGPVFFTIF
jgi:hypothetical protein